MTAGSPASAAVLRANREPLAARALETAIDRDPTIRERYDDARLRKLLHDTGVLLDQVSTAVASSDPGVVAAWAEWLAPIFRRRAVPMDDLVQVAEGLRTAAAAVLPPGQEGVLHTAIDEAVRVFRWHRRLGGDARRRNRLLAAIYRGA